MYRLSAHSLCTCAARAAAAGQDRQMHGGLRCRLAEAGWRPAACPPRVVIRQRARQQASECGLPGGSVSPGTGRAQTSPPACPPPASAGCAAGGGNGCTGRQGRSPLSGSGTAGQASGHTSERPHQPTACAARTTLSKGPRCQEGSLWARLQRSTQARSPMPTGRTAVTRAASYRRRAPAAARCCTYRASARTWEGGWGGGAGGQEAGLMGSSGRGGPQQSATGAGLLRLHVPQTNNHKPATAPQPSSPPCSSSAAPLPGCRCAAARRRSPPREPPASRGQRRRLGRPPATWRRRCAGRRQLDSRLG